MIDFSREKINKNNSHNIIAIVAQVIVKGMTLFILYRYLYDLLGIEQIGIWSLVTSVTSVSRIGEMGLSSTVVKFVAQALGQRDTKLAADVVQTVGLTLGASMALLLILCYPLFVLALKNFLPMESLLVALDILPYALLLLWVMVIISVFSGGLDGCLRMDLRSLLIGISSLVYLGLVMLMAPKYGLEGVVIAQLIQSVGLMFLLWWMLRRQLKDLPIIPRTWKFPILKEVFVYGMTFQVSSIMNMLFDPMAKALMSKFGGLESLGYYVMANNFILQGRALIIEASRIIVPTVAILQEHDGSKTRQLYITSYRITFYVSLLLYGLLGISLPTISILWIGHYQPIFIQYAILLIVCWFINTLIGPAYFSNLGSGKLRNNVISDAIMTMYTLTVGTFLGVTYGGIGVVLGVGTAIIIGSLYLLISHTQGVGLYWQTFIIPQSMSGLLISSILLIFVSNYKHSQLSSTFVVIGTAVLCSISLLLLGWFAPVRKMFSLKIKHEA